MIVFSCLDISLIYTTAFLETGHQSGECLVFLVTAMAGIFAFLRLFHLPTVSSLFLRFL